MKDILDLISSKYSLSELDASGFDTVKVSGMTFKIRPYRAEGLGYVSTMQAAGFFGLMKMDTLIINPVDIDLPLLSYDRIKAMGNDKLFLEMYDTMVNKTSMDKVSKVKESYGDKPTHTPSSAWYDDIKLPQSMFPSGKKKDSESFDKITLSFVKAFLDTEAPAVTDPEAKAAKIDYYVDGLLSHGGPATDVFVKKFGKEKTTELFKKCLFVR